MSFDVYAQRFVDGEPADADSEVLRELLAPHVARVESDFGFAELRFDDGSLDFYGVDEPGSGFMVNHVSGQLSWDLIALVAARGDMALIAPGVPPMVFSEAARGNLPEGLDGEAVVVTSGADILRTIAEA